MGHSQDEKAKSHKRIVEIASARIRESGTEGPGVAEIMEAAGLTHGGFYKHFQSRDDLIAQAADQAFADGSQAFLAVTEGADDPLAAFVDWYVSAEHRDDPATGCGVVALGADAVRAGDHVREAYRDQVQRYLSNLTRLFGDGPDARRQATLALSTMVGALLVARGVGDDALSDEILANVREAVKGRVTEPSAPPAPASPGRPTDTP
jgi:TetR/AcrR family transcriptional regulator, transcriptional repressor for nem operon